MVRSMVVSFPPEQLYYDQDDRDEDEEGQDQSNNQGQVRGGRRRRGRGSWRRLSPVKYDRVQTSCNSVPVSMHAKQHGLFIVRTFAHAPRTVLGGDVLAHAVPAPVLGRGTGALPSTMLQAVGAAVAPLAPAGPPAVLGRAHVVAGFLLDRLAIARRAAVERLGAVASPGAFPEAAAALLGVAAGPGGPRGPCSRH